MSSFFKSLTVLDMSFSSLYIYSRKSGQYAVFPLPFIFFFDIIEQ